MKTRGIRGLFYGRTTYDGAGVKLKRVFGEGQARLFDPFLLLDDFGSEDPDEYLPGFPMHPHRGIETVTYMLEGRVRHGDSLGNSGTIGPGDLQWMTAGSGILHEEMPQVSPKGIRGFQLWVNLPASEKMRNPEYRDAKSTDIPIITLPEGEARAISGKFGAYDGVFRDISGNPSYADIRLAPGAEIELAAALGETVFAYVFEGSARNSGWAKGEGEAGGKGLAEGIEPPKDQRFLEEGTCVLFDEGDAVSIAAGPRGCRFLLVRGKPLGEPIAWGGPIVMNTRAEIAQAFRELENGTFVKKERLR
jgi:quercetin 2,3-dioxygenase